MVDIRVAVGPAVVLAALRLDHPEAWLGCMIAVGLVSDVYDGILARRWGTESARLRVADSAADTVFYLGVLTAIVLRHWPVLREHIGLLTALMLLEGLRLIFDWVKFRRMASYHSYASKIWGILLATTAIALLCFNRAFWLVSVALVWGIMCDLEGLVISALLPRWAHDVKTLGRAVRLRKKMLAETQIR
jgi:CDP-diacylglycerol--glycerol-3-phosphate 3-phosphatidyltransferase